MPRISVNCIECSAQFDAEWKGYGNPPQVCSRQCKLARKRRSNRRDRSPRRCAHCHSVFALAPGSKRRWFCSDECGRRSRKRRYRTEATDKNHRRRARRRNLPYEPISRVRLFERDGWSCQICGVATPQHLSGSTHPDAPELDHRLPLAAGGSHTWDNVQCACRRCNIRKGSLAPPQANAG